MTSTAIVNKVWNFCHTLRDDCVGYGMSGRFAPMRSRYTLHSCLHIGMNISKIEAISS